MATAAVSTHHTATHSCWRIILFGGGGSGQSISPLTKLWTQNGNITDFTCQSYSMKFWLGMGRASSSNRYQYSRCTQVMGRVVCVWGGGGEVTGPWGHGVHGILAKYTVGSLPPSGTAPLPIILDPPLLMLDSYLRRNDERQLCASDRRFTFLCSRDNRYEL